MRFSALKRTLLILSLAAMMVGLAFTPVLAAVNEIIWRRFFNETGIATRVAADKNGNVVVVGSTTGNPSDGGPAFVRKLSGGGRLLWHRESGNSTVFWDVAIDSDGYIYIAGQTQDHESSDGFFVSKYGPKGGHHWTRQISKNTGVEVTGIDVGPSGNIYVVGSAFGALPNMPRSSQSGDAFIRKYNPDGKIYWTRQFSLNGFQASTGAFDVAVGPGGGVYVAGIDGSESRAKDGLFLRKLSPRGGIYWTRRVSRAEPYFSVMGRIAVDRAGGVAIVANDAFLMQVFTVKYTHKGKRLWTRLWDSPEAWDVAVDRDRSIYIVGVDNNPRAFGRNGNYDIRAFARKYDSAGTHRWTRYFANGIAVGVAADSTNNVYVSGARFLESSLESPDSFLVKFRR